jgi:hypothetical protein
MCIFGLFSFGLSAFLVPSGFEAPVGDWYPGRVPQLLWQYFFFFSSDVVSFLPLFSFCYWATILLGFLLCAISLLVDLILGDSERY